MCWEEAGRVEPHDPLRASRILFHVWDHYQEQSTITRSRTVLDRILAMSAGAPDDQQVLGARAWQAMMEADFAEARAFATRGVELSADRVNERATEFPLILAVIGDVEPAAAAIQPVVTAFGRTAPSST